jgi:rubrerythrin
MIIALAALMVIGALFLTLRIKESSLPPAESETPIKPLEEAKVRIYEALRDLQFEYRVGKLSDADYQAAKHELQKELARVLQQMDEAGVAPAPAARKTAPAPKQNVCPHCGTSFKEKLKFCGQCGKPMEVEA